MTETESLLHGLVVFFVAPAIVWWIMLAVRLGQSARGPARKGKGGKIRKW